MLKQHATILRRLMILVDLSLVAGCFLAGYYLRGSEETLRPLREYLWILPVVVVLWGALLYSGGMYSSFRLKKIPDVFMIIGQSAFFGIGIFGSINYLLKIQDVSRGFILIVFGLSAVVLMLEKMVVIVFFRSLRKKGFNYKNILIVGTGERAQRFIRQLEYNREFGLKVFGVVDGDRTRTGQDCCGHPVIGSFDDIPVILKENPIDHVVFIVPRSQLTDIEQPILYCETVGVTVSVAVDLFNMRLTTGKESSILGLPILTFESTPDKIWELMLKRLTDIVLSFVMLVLLSPVFLVLAVVIKLSSPGPVLFAQRRVGLNGRKFMLYKFRTMVADAEDRLEELRGQNEMEGPVFKMENDPRLTSVGKFLRKTSLDEFPQLVNVLKGDMSLVGPRPPIDHEVEEYDHWQRRRLSMRPGITCFWQISGRNKIVDFDRWMELDLQYIDNWSLLLDFSILFKTVPVVLFGVGAK